MIAIIQLAFFVLALLILILLVVSKKKFVLPETRLSLPARIILIVIITLIILIVSDSVGTAYYYAFHPDYGYDKVVKEVSYHIYVPKVLPENQQPITQFYIYEKTFAGQTNAVKVFYGIPTFLRQKGQKDYIVALTQVHVASNFSIADFIKSDSQGKLSISDYKQISLAQWPNQPAYLRNTEFPSLIILTPDNVLIEMATPSVSGDDLIKIAESLQ